MINLMQQVNRLSNRTIMTKMKVCSAHMMQKNIRKNMSKTQHHLNNLYPRSVTHQDREEMLSLTQSIALMFMT